VKLLASVSTQGLSEMPEIYPLGRANCRLWLVDGETGKCLRIAMLCCLTLVEGVDSRSSGTCSLSMSTCSWN
jgi:hypothetical protein